MSVMLIPIALFFSFFFRVLDGDTIICFSRNKFFSRELLYCGTRGVFVYRAVRGEACGSAMKVSTGFMNICCV
ncbi:hypothetical protein [Neisseria sp. HMSC065D04]|uniref:hypothetical protein n=1 Tax=Neisseria sp. HMSC065D04 TaxID=1739542 RepID=UPI00143CBB11|nr:hypothetical protein [Neisseria sp. HMSC065D04]